MGCSNSTKQLSVQIHIYDSGGTDWDFSLCAFCIESFCSFPLIKGTQY